MLSYAPDQTIHGFRVRRVADLPALQDHYMRLDHEATGATLYYSDRDDGQMIFGVAFRTLPENDTGVFHILEHSCLDGSEHYRLKEPFVNLLKTSMAVDLNAMTYEDKTVYYFISTNEQDYRNILSVYMDAVFYPLLLTDRRIFEKEAWHTEPDGQGGVGISGVVYNEMQGTENRPQMALWLASERQLFPDTHLRFNSGGDPAAIPDLTYEEFVDTYRRNYRPDNAVFYLSGDLDLPETLAYLDEVLTTRAADPAYAPVGDPPAIAPLQAPVISPLGTCTYPLGDNEDLAGNTRLMLAYVLEPDRPEDVLAFSLLIDYLTNNTDSPLTRAVLETDVGQDFDMAVEGEYRQPLVAFTLERSDPEKAETFRQVILESLSRLVKQGFDRALLSDLITAAETDSRRAAINVRTGFQIMETMLRLHIAQGDALWSDSVVRLRERLSEDEAYFEHLVERAILQSSHWALTRCVPSRTLTQERRQNVEKRLQAEADRLAAIPGGYDDLIAHNQALNDYLTAPDRPEDQATIPHLSPADVDATHRVQDMAEEVDVAVGKARSMSLFYEADMQGMTQVGLTFDLSAIPLQDLIYVRCLRSALAALPTASHSLNDLLARWVSLRTYFNVNLSVEHIDTAHLSLELDAPEEVLPAAVALMDEYIREVCYDREALQDIFSNAADLRDGMVSRGNRTAMRLCMRSLCVAGVYMDHLSGLSAYRFLSHLADHFDEEYDSLVAGMTRVWYHLTRRVSPIAFCIGSRSAYATWRDALATLSLGDEAHLPCTPAPRPLYPRRNFALSVPGEVNYCARMVDMRGLPEEQVYDPRYSVVHNYLYSLYFWDEIRARGGAYGASATAHAHGLLSYASYRDPRVADTYAVYDGLADWLESHIPDQDTVDSLIVSVVGSSFFAPQGPDDKGFAALTRYLSRRTADHVRQDLQRILSTTPADFNAYAAALRDRQAAGHTVSAALGNAARLRESGLFAPDEIEEL